MEIARYGRIGLTKLRRWPCLVLGRPPRQGYASGRRIHGVIAASLGDAMHAILIVLVAAIEIAVGSADDDAEGIIY